MADLHAHHCHHVGHSINHISEYFLPSFWHHILASTILLRIKHLRDGLESSFARLASVGFVPIVCIPLDIEGESQDLLNVDQVEMDGVSVGCQVDNVEIVDFACCVFGNLLI